MIAAILLLGLSSFANAGEPLLGPPTPIYIDVDTIRYYLSNVKVDPQVEKVINEVLDQSEGVSITPTSDGSDLVAEFKSDFTISISDPHKTPEMHLYALYLPARLSINVSMDNGVMTITGFDQGTDRLYADVKIPLLSNKIRIRSAEIDLNKGVAHINAGILDDVITIEGDATIDPAHFGLDIWQSICANFAWITDPFLEFKIK